MMTLLHEYGHLIKDFGPHYHEFNPDSWIKEPWNAASSLFFLVPVIYWFWILKGRYKEYAHITVVLPLLALNGIGSTLYHAFRAYDAFLILDFAPAALMSLFVAGYLWNKIVQNIPLTVLIIIGMSSLRFLIGYIGVDKSNAINIGYFLTGMMFLIPTLIILAKTSWYKWHLVALTALFLCMALLFRYLDYPRENLIEPIGTHFLWHIVSAFAVFSLGWYLYYLKDINLNSPFVRPDKDRDI